MSTPTDGGPAFPSTVPEYIDPHGRVQGNREAIHILGMTLRDYFAAEVKLTDFDMNLIELYLGDGPKTVQETIEFISGLRFRHADAMLEARKVKE